MYKEKAADIIRGKILLDDYPFFMTLTVQNNSGDPISLRLTGLWYDWSTSPRLFLQ